MNMKKLRTIFTGLLAIATLSAYAADNAFTLNTNAFHNAGPLPVLYTCDGKNVSPELDWSNIPPKTQSLAIIMSDPDAPGAMFYHWIVYNIPTSVKAIDETINQLPTGAVAGKNDFGNMEYNGPCPPKGAAHTYSITLYALDSKLNLPTGANAEQVINAMQNHILDKVVLTTVYSRWLK